MHDLEVEFAPHSSCFGIGSGMDKYIDGRFERLEKALSNLIDSITKYHPSILQADELRAADDELHKGLEEGSLGRTPC